MLVGLLSDTHGHVDPAKAAIAMLLAGGAQALIHCGDVGCTAVLDLLAGGVPAYFVFGNNDYDRDDLRTYARHLGVTCLGAAGDVTLGDKLAVVLHGDDATAKRRALARPDVAYVFQGHTHVPRDQTIGRVRSINPGALYRASTKTVALLDTDSDELRFLRP